MQPDMDRVRQIYSDAKRSTSTNTNAHEQSGVTDRLKMRIVDAGGVAIKLHGGAMFSGHPDLFGCLYGIAFVIETKRSGAKGPTSRQSENLRRWKKAGAVSFWTDDAERGFAQLVSETKDRVGMVK